MLQLTNADQGRTYALIILEKARLYITAATVPEGSIPPGHFQQFEVLGHSWHPESWVWSKEN